MRRRTDFETKRLNIDELKGRYGAGFAEGGEKIARAVAEAVEHSFAGGRTKVFI